MKIYIASPYGRRVHSRLAKREENAWRQIEAGRELILKGHTPLIPLLYHYVHRDWAKSPDEDRWHKMCLAWLINCDAILRLSGKSWGADDEVGLGKALGLKIYYSLEEVPDEI